MAVEMRPIGRLTPFAGNARTHSTEQIDAIAASMREWGWTMPVLIDETGSIIAGHARVLAGQRLSFTEVPVMIARGWSEAKRRAYVLADNKLALNSGWDEDVLAAELAALKDLGFKLELSGFSDAEIIALFDRGKERKTDPDAIPETPEDAVSIAGDTWLLGKHRIRCGSSTSAEDVKALLASATPHLMVTDPPYGVEYDPTWRPRAGVNQSKRTGTVANDDKADWTDAWALFPGDVAYVWHAAIHSSTVDANLKAAGFEIRAQIIWAKERLVVGRGDYHWQHEPAWYAVRKGAKGHWAGDRKQTTLWAIANVGQDAKTVHGTQKPVICMQRPIENNSRVGDCVYEPFSGSGTTIIAAEASGRACFAMELKPVYVDVAITRWQNFTGEKAILEGDGRSFAAVEKVRREAAA